MSAAHILVIRLGALGDIVLSLGPMAAIRRHHPEAKITLLTTRPFASFLGASGYFDDIWIDERQPWWRVDRLLAFRCRLIEAKFDRVYDLQTSGRSARYLRLFPAPKPEWSGHALGASHSDRVNPLRETSHTIDRQREQLRLAGIEDVPPGDLSWVRDTDIARFNLPERFALLVPGGSAHRTEKRWPAERYVELGQWLAAHGVAPVIVGAAAEADLAAGIAAAIPGAINLADRTALEDLVTLGRNAVAAIGNDTGPMHIFATAGAPGAVLFSNASDPARCAPRAECMVVLQSPSLANLSVQTVSEALETASILDKSRAKPQGPVPLRNPY
jgi:ADP-heptose:LPS heptosyltransferase